MKKPYLLSIALFSLSAFYRDTVCASVAPEKDSIRISNTLKAYSNQDWNSLAGSKSSEKYEIARGDTLWDISSRLFGEAKVWPKIWEINNTEILNPHMIEPRTLLVFNAGSGFSLPNLLLKSTGTTTVTNHYRVDPDDHPGAVWDEKTPMPSREWKNLPRQSWENVRVDFPPNIDKDGFDSRNKVYLIKPKTGLDLPHIMACDKVQPLAVVIGTRSITNHVDRGSEITIRSNGTALEIGKVYSLLDPDPLTVDSDGRRAYSYALQGKVKILGLQNGTYVGEIQNIKNPVGRGAFLVPEVLRLEKIPPVAGASKVKGSLIADRRTGAFMSGQNKWVYIDRGTKDGVDRGMIFRIFQNQDPKNGKRLTQGDVFVQGDVQILQGCEHFSVGMFVWSRGEVPERYEGNLLSDVSDEKVRFYFNGSPSELETREAPVHLMPEGIVDAPNGDSPTDSMGEPLGDTMIAPTDDSKDTVLDPSATPELFTPPPEMHSGEGEDWLDRLDTNEGINTEEENELQQLEKFRESQAQMEAAPPANTPPRSSATAPKTPSPADDSSVDGVSPL